MPCGRPTRPRCSNLDKDNFKLDRWPHLREDRSLDTCLIVRAPVISGCDSAIRVGILTRYLLIPTAPISTRFHPLDYPGCDWRVARTCWWNARQRTGGRATPALNMSWCRWLDVGCVVSLFSHHRHRCRHLIHHSHSWYYYDNYNVNRETSVTVIVSPMTFVSCLHDLWVVYPVTVWSAWMSTCPPPTSTPRSIPLLLASKSTPGTLSAWVKLLLYLLLEQTNKLTFSLFICLLHTYGATKPRPSTLDERRRVGRRRGNCKQSCRCLRCGGEAVVVSCD